MIDFKSVGDHGGVVVFADSQCLAAISAILVGGRRIIFDVIRRSALFANPSAGHSLNNIVVVDLYRNHGVNLTSEFGSAFYPKPPPGE